MSKEKKTFIVLVFCSAFCCLMFELIVSRLADFYLDFRNSYLAIPITFLGLALGSLHVHFRRKLVEHFDLRRTLVLLAVVSSVMMLSAFVIFGRFLTVIGSPDSAGVARTGLLKIPVFILVFSIPFYYFGRILTVSYHLNRDRIGAIYCADFFGAALACLLTPLCLHAFQLPGVVLVFLLATWIVTLIFLRLPRARTLVLGVAAVALSVGLYRGIVYLDRTNDFGAFLPVVPGQECNEIAHGWNEFSRVSLIRNVRSKGATPSYVIVHQNAASNVNVRAYTSGDAPKPDALGIYDAALILRPNPSDILVMFAGAGDEMIQFEQRAGTQCKVTGVEINPLVKDLAANIPDLASYRLKEFYSLPNVNLCIHEGRSFLQSTPDQYDIIFVGSKAAVNVRLAGSTRMYLDTEEAYALYLKHLKKGGILIFDHQPIGRTLDSLKWVFHDQGIPNFDKCVFAMKSRTGGKDLVVAPDGFSDAAMRAVMALDAKSKKTIYAPVLRERPGNYVYSMAKSEPDTGYLRSTDDRPFEFDLDIKNYSPFPKKDVATMYDIPGWINITTMLIILPIVLLFIALAYLRPGTRLPAVTLVYLLITGFCYLVVEIVFIGRLELFMQDPLVSMAAVLTIFLLTSGLGSFLFQRVSPWLRMDVFPLLVAALVFGSIYALTYINTHWLGLPLPVRLLVASALMAPIGLCLGMFYPFAVAALVKNERDAAVPVTYGISTLASVIGATYAMTMVIEFGFNRLMTQAALGYVLLAVLVFLYTRVARRRMLSL